MNIIETIRSFIPYFKKDTLLEDLDITLQLIPECIIAYKKAEDDFPNKFKNNIVSGLSTDYFRDIRTKIKGSKNNLISDILLRLENTQVNLKSIEKLATELLENDIIKEGLTAKKANYIQVASYGSFIAEFSLDLLNYIYILETYNKSSNNIPGDLPKGKKEYIHLNIYEFGRILNILGKENKDFIQDIDKIPEIVINETTEKTVLSVYGNDKLNLFGNSIRSGFEGNPIYHVRLMIAEYQANKFKRNKDLLQQLQLRKLDLESQSRNEISPSVQKQIELISDRIEILEAKIRRETEK